MIFKQIDVVTNITQETKSFFFNHGIKTVPMIVVADAMESNKILFTVTGGSWVLSHYITNPTTWLAPSTITTKAEEEHEVACLDLLPRKVWAIPAPTCEEEEEEEEEEEKKKKKESVKKKENVEEEKVASPPPPSKRYHSAYCSPEKQYFYEEEEEEEEGEVEGKEEKEEKREQAEREREQEKAKQEQEKAEAEAEEDDLTDLDFVA
ncbi:unnamed protein product [Rotaria magnacalcarata]|uniref:Uncharacterized protein n=1 Tax=Rotaria magnacalcarata TaxID=392030 RepID=A0A8S2JQI5_9BILA|nr:unnamed protein product [Rotaria magnacalcarata]